MGAMAALATAGQLPQQQASQHRRSGWQQQRPGSAGGGSQRRSVAAAAKRKGVSGTGKSSAGGGGRGRVAPKDRAALRELSVALQDPRRGSGNGGGFGAPSGGRRGSGGGRREQEEQAADAEGESDWDEALLADLSDSEVAELIGEEESAGDPLAGFDPAVSAAVEAVVGRFAFQLDPFQIKAVAHLLAGKSGELAAWQAGRQAGREGWV